MSEDKPKKTRGRKTKRRGTKDSSTLQKEWDDYSRKKEQEQKKLKQPKEGKRDKKKSKRHKEKTKDRKKSHTPKPKDDGFGEIQNKSKLKVKATNVKKIEFSDDADMGQSKISYGTPRGTTPRGTDSGFKKRKKSKDTKAAKMKRGASAAHLDDTQKERLKQQRLQKLNRIRAEKAAAISKKKDDETFNSLAVKTDAKKEKKPKRRRTASKAQAYTPTKDGDKKHKKDKKKEEKQETAEEKKARKEKEKTERLERLKQMRSKHEDEQKEKQQELDAFVQKRDAKRYTHPVDKYPKDKETSTQCIYRSLKNLKEICPVTEWSYDPNKKHNEPILNPFGLTITHMDCLWAYYMVDSDWSGSITKAQYVHSIKHLLQIKEWNDDKINVVWDNLQHAKDITQKYLEEYKEDSKDVDPEELKADVAYNYEAREDGLTFADFINGMELTKQSGNSAVYDFYYLLLGGHYYDESLSESDDWHGDFTQRVQWLKQFGHKMEILYSVDTGHSYIGACHGMREYRAIICSLLNVDFLPPSDKHSGEIVSKFKEFIANTVGSIKMFQYEWFQAEVMIGAAKVAILRSDIMYSSMRPINTILRECDRLLTMLESKVLVQLAMHLMKVIVIHCPNKQQDLLLKELSGLISRPSYRKRPFNPLQQLLLLLLVAIDRYNIQNSKTWQKIAAVALFACTHEKQEICDLGEEVLWRIYTFSPSVGEDVLSNKMERHKAREVRKALGIEKYWEEQAKQKANMKTIKIYQDTDAIPNHWKKLTYNPEESEMSPARLWTMMQQAVYGRIRLLEEHPSMNYDDFVKGLSQCQTYLRSSSVRALFQCLPRKHRPFVTKQEFIDFICIVHVATNRRHYSLRIKELLTIFEDKWKTREAKKKQKAEEKAIKRELERKKRKEEREERKKQREERKREEKRKQKEEEQKWKEQQLATQEAERLAKLEEERKKAEAERPPEKEEEEINEKASKKKKEKKKKTKKEKKKKEKKEKEEKKKSAHQKTKTREEEIMDDVVALLDYGEEDDFDWMQYKDADSDTESELSVMINNPVADRITPLKTTAGYSAHLNKKRNSMHTPSRTLHTEEASQHGFRSSIDFDTMQSQDLGDFNFFDKMMEPKEIKRDKLMESKIIKVGLRAKEIYKINRDDVYEQRSKILYDTKLLASTFKNKMGKDFCLNAAATQIIFVAGMQDKGCNLDDDQLDIIYCGVQYFLPMFEWDLPSSVAEWVILDETAQDKTSRRERDHKRWEKEKKYLPTYLKHELIAFIFGETYFDLTELDRKKKKIQRKKGEPVVHRNENYVGSCVSELHDVNLPKTHYTKLIRGFCRESCGNDTICNLSTSILYCVSFFMPLSQKGPDDFGNLEVHCLVLDRTFHPDKMSANEGFNEYDTVRIKRTGRITTIPFENDTGKGGVLLIKIYGELFIDRHATIDADSCGYSGGWHKRSQGDSFHRCGITDKYCNYGGGGGGYYGGGGGYGSRGVTPTSDVPGLLTRGERGRKYGTHLVHKRAFMGSGGGAGGGKYLYSRGGRGGGVVVVIAGCIHNKGRIMALGQRGRYLAGSGAGGSIVVECNSYYHYGKGGILSSSLDPYPDVASKSFTGGIGGCGRVAIKINRQKWSSAMIKAICTSDIKKIWTPAAWIYPYPLWVQPDRMNDKHTVKPKLVGFQSMSRIEPTVYKNCTIFRLPDEFGDGPLVNSFTKYGEREHKEVEAYKKRIEKDKKTLWDWKFEEFALQNRQQTASEKFQPTYRSSVKGTQHAK